MQFRYFFVLPLLTLPVFLIAQELGTDPSGRRTVTWPDGSWRYVDPDNPRDKKMLEEEGQRLRQAARQAVFSRARDSLLFAVEAEKKALLQKALVEERIMEVKRSKDRQERMPTVTMERDLEKAIEEVERRQSEKSKWEDLLEYAKRLAESSDDEAPQWEEKLAFSGLLQHNGGTTNTIDGGIEDIPEPAKWNPLLDLATHPPTEPCAVEAGPLDELTGQQPMRSVPKPLFSSTSERLRPLMGTEDFVTATASLYRYDENNWVLALEVTIASQFAQKEFGMLEKGSLLVLYGISGYQIPLYNAATSTGQLNPVAKTVTYTGRYAIDKKSIKTLRDMELDRVRVVWSTGYEDYEIYELDFFSQQFRCLNQ